MRMKAAVEAPGRGLAGVDEAGRGALCGPVFAAAVVLDPECRPPGLRDSKQLSVAARERLAELIRERACTWAVASAGVEEIERLNILHASLLAMRRAVLKLRPLPERAFIDGLQCPKLPCPSRAVVRGDSSMEMISAASILAKVARDAYMCELAQRYPGYGLERHKGYGTATHLGRLRRLGPCHEHRRGFAPVRRLLAGELL